MTTSKCCEEQSFCRSNIYFDLALVKYYFSLDFNFIVYHYDLNGNILMNSFLSFKSCPYCGLQRSRSLALSPIFPTIFPFSVPQKSQLWFCFRVFVHVLYQENVHSPNIHMVSSLTLFNSLFSLHQNQKGFSDYIYNSTSFLYISPYCNLFFIVYTTSCQ